MVKAFGCGDDSWIGMIRKFRASLNELKTKEAPLHAFRLNDRKEDMKDIKHSLIDAPRRSVHNLVVHNTIRDAADVHHMRVRDLFDLANFDGLLSM